MGTLPLLQFILHKVISLFLKEQPTVKNVKDQKMLFAMYMTKKNCYSEFVGKLYNRITLQKNEERNRYMKLWSTLLEVQGK